MTDLTETSTCLNPSWDKIFNYDETVDSCLIWKVSRARQKVGQVAGSVHKKGYIRIRYNYKNYLAHRIVYELCTGLKIKDDEQIDHIDGNVFNNKIENLRKVTPEKQSRNLKQYSTNKSGVTGVRYCRMGNHEYCQSYWMDSGSKKFFTTRCDKFGKENSFELCELVREEAIDKLNQLGAEYTSRHGKPT